MAKNAVRTSITLSRDVLAKVKSRAAIDGVSEGALMADAVAAYVGQARAAPTLKRVNDERSLTARDIEAIAQAVDTIDRALKI